MAVLTITVPAGKVPNIIAAIEGKRAGFPRLEEEVGDDAAYAKRWLIAALRDLVYVHEHRVAKLAIVVVPDEEIAT